MKSLQKFNMDDAKPSQIPAKPGQHLQEPKDGREEQDQLYRKAVGSLAVLLTAVIRPDIAYAVN